MADQHAREAGGITAAQASYENGNHNGQPTAWMDTTASNPYADPNFQAPGQQYAPTWDSSNNPGGAAPVQSAPATGVAPGLATPSANATPAQKQETRVDGLAANYDDLYNHVKGANYGIDYAGDVANNARNANFNGIALAANGQDRAGLVDQNGGGHMGGYGNAMQSAIQAGAGVQQGIGLAGVNMDINKFNANALKDRDSLAGNILSSDHTAQGYADLTNQANNQANTQWNQQFQTGQAAQTQANYNTTRQDNQTNAANANAGAGVAGVLGTIGTIGGALVGQPAIGAAIGKAIGGGLSGATPSDTPAKTYSVASVGGIKPRQPQYGVFSHNASGGIG